MSEYVPGTEISKPSVKLVGKDGNAFAILGAVHAALAKAGVPKEVQTKFMDEAMDGDYDHLLQVVMTYVDVC
jgi:hypothetical protein